MVKLLMAGLGTAAFAVLFSVPASLYISCGLTGAAGYLVYALLMDAGFSATMATFFATVAVVLLARFLAVWRKAPSTIFLITGVFPLVPGAGIYWTSYYLVTGQMRPALESGFAAVKAAVAIVLAMVMIFEIPGRVFHVSLTGKGRIRHGNHRDNP